MSQHPDSARMEASETGRFRTMPRVAAGLAGLAAFVAVWFGIAGRANWVQGWMFLGLFVAYSTALAVRLTRSDPGLLRERTRRAENVEAWDRVIVRWYTALLLVLLILAALDSGRFRWSTVPIWVQVGAWVPLCLGGGIIWRVMAVNAYTSSWARIQDDRGQVVVSRGPYKQVRHPMYLGIIIGFAFIPLALASWWALVPATPIVGLFVYRTAREDRMLLDGLGGYEDYAEEVRYRLIPGVW